MHQKKDIVNICRRVYAKEFVAATDGNISARTNDGRLLITRSGLCKGDAVEEDILTIDSEGNLLEGNGRVTTEVKIHLLLYKSRPDVNAVIHGHPIYSTAFASSGISLDRPVFPEVILSIGRIPLCAYGTPSTDELPLSMKPHISYANVFLLENHGAVSTGKSLMEAFYRMDKLEHYAKTITVARTIGREKILTDDKLRKLYDLSDKVYGIKLNPKNRY